MSTLSSRGMKTNARAAARSAVVNGTAIWFALASWALILAAAILVALPATASVKDQRGFQQQMDESRELRCLALNIYHEARGESDAGKLAVGHVVMNRVDDSRFPSGVCDVIEQGGFKRRHRCQFSWWCDGRSDKPRNTTAWTRSQELARKIYAGMSSDPTRGALWYHADYVDPTWKDSFRRGPKIGRHIFYFRNATRGQRAKLRNRKKNSQLTQRNTEAGREIAPTFGWIMSVPIKPLVLTAN